MNNEFTTIKLRRTTVEKLKFHGRKGETYEIIVSRLMKNLREIR